MAEAAPQTEGNEARRRAMLQAAAELIAERGFGETRIADVAKRAGTSSGLVIYYFGTRDRLLVDALRFSEEAYYDARGHARSATSTTSATASRCSSSGRACPSCPGEVSGSWGLWLDLWSTALRHPEVREARVELDGRWRDLIERIVARGPGVRRGRRRCRRAPLRAQLHRPPRRPLHPGRARRPRDHLRRRLRHRHGVRRAAPRPHPPASAAPRSASAEPAPRRTSSPTYLPASCDPCCFIKVCRSVRTSRLCTPGEVIFTWLARRSRSASRSSR